MFFDAAGKPLYPGKVVKTFDWLVGMDSALPNWLATLGTTPVSTFVGPATSKGGVLRMTTKAATPASGDIAGLQTAFNIDYSLYEEVSFGLYGVTSPDAASSTDHTISIESNNGSTAGFYIQSRFDAADGLTGMRVFPGALEYKTWPINSVGNYAKRKDLFVTIRPRTKELFFTSGDPYEGAGVILQTNLLVPPTGQSLKAQIISRTGAQRTMETSRVKLRLVHN